MPKATGKQETDASRIDPFLRWAGGKRRLVSALLESLPTDIASRTYHEVFVGAGSLFLALRPKRAVLSDANEHLIACYEQVRENPERVADYLQSHLRRNSKKYYYEVREDYNRLGMSAAQAARFVYLNKTCFNGIFRVNMQGDFNVPYGYKKSPPIPTKNELITISSLLKKSSLHARSFDAALEDVGKDDFAYLDPPYPPLNGTAYFTHYTAERFGEADQRNLAAAVTSMAKRGALFMMSNADTPMIRDIYGDFDFFEVNVTRFVTCKAKKHKAAELIITNYPVERKSNA